MSTEYNFKINGAGVWFMDKAGEVPEKYIINDNATILFWDDGTKTIVKKSENDVNDPIKSFLWAYFQKMSGLSKTKANKYLSELVVENKEDKTLDNVLGLKPGDKVRIVSRIHYHDFQIGEIVEFVEYDGRGYNFKDNGGLEQYLYPCDFKRI